MAESNRLPREHREAGLLLQRLVVGPDHVRIHDLRICDVLTHGLAVDGERIGMNTAGLQQFVHHRRQPAGAIIFLAEIVAGRLHVDQQRHVVADRLPVLDREGNADMPRDRIDVDRRIGRAADRRAGDDRVLERLAGEDVGRLAGSRARSRPRAGRSRRRSARARDRAPGSRRSPAATCRALRRARSWSRPCPWCCNGRPTAPRRRPHRGIRDSRCARRRAPGAPTTRPCRSRRARPCHQPFSIGPPDSTIAGMFTVAAAMMQAGVVLSQPVVSTTPSSG